MNKINLYHYSNKDIKGFLSPDYFGDNTYTNYSRDISSSKRLYFYLYPDESEYFFWGAKYKYTCRINKTKLYDLNNDKLKLLKYSLDKIILKIKRLGYIGFIGNNGFKIACLFNNIRIIKKEVL